MTIDQLLDHHRPLAKMLLTAGSVQIEQNIWQSINCLRLANLSVVDKADMSLLTEAGFVMEELDLDKKTMLLTAIDAPPQVASTPQPDVSAPVPVPVVIDSANGTPSMAERLSDYNPLA